MISSQELRRPLIGPLHMERRERGQFVIRHDPEHVTEVCVAIAARKLRARLEEASRRERVEVRLLRLA
jgi:hypothetical protein